MTILLQPLAGSALLGAGTVAASAAAMELEAVFADMSAAMGGGDEIESYSRLLSGTLYSAEPQQSDRPPSLVEQLQAHGFGYTEQRALAFPANIREPILQSLIRESGVSIPYRSTVLHAQSGLTPSYMHCELDALAMARALLELGAEDVRILEVRSKGPELYHAHSVWRTDDHLTLYEGIHFAALVGGRVYDLQTMLDPGIPLAEYLSQSFPHQEITTTTFLPNAFRARQRSLRHYHLARSQGFQDFPELIEDAQFPDPKTPIKSLQQVMREARARRARAVGA